MKKGTKLIILFDLLIFIIFLLNSFVSSILSGYKLIFFLVFLITIFKYFLGIEKDRHRYTKDILIELIIIITIYYIIYYLFGIITGFTRTGNYYNYYGIKSFLLPIILTIILKEYLRYNLMIKSSENKYLIVLNCVLFILFDIINELSGIGEGNYNIFMFAAKTLLPAISINISCSYLTLKHGYKPNMFMRLLLTLVQYLMPIFPASNDYIRALVNFLIPIIITYRLVKYIEKYEDKEIEIERKNKNYASLIITALVTMVLAYLISGYFKYTVVAVASGSMEKTIYRGDAVLIEKTNDYKNIKKNQVLVFKHNGIIVIHRVIKKVTDGEHYYFYTKGDANAFADNYKIEEKDVVGIVKFKIVKVGYPTIWLNEL